MSLQCRIVYKNDNTIDYLETPQGERSELFDELVQVMGGDKDSALNMYALTESEDFKTLYNGYTENKTEQYENKQLPSTEKRTNSEAGRVAEEATIIARGSSSTSAKSETRDDQINTLIQWSKSNGTYLENYEELGVFIDKGMESEVFFKDNNVFKVNDLEFYGTPLDYLNSTSEHNKLFPESPYKVVGFTIRKDTGNFAVIVEQPFIKAERGATQQEVEQEMSKMGFTRTEENTYENDNYTLEDLHEGNILIDNQGNLFFIDPVIRIKENSEREIDQVYKKASESNDFESFLDSMSDYRDAHSAPSKDTTPTKEKLETGGDFSLREVAKGFHNQPDDYFDSKVGAKYYGYNTQQGMESFTAINNVIRALKADNNNITITTYRAIPSNINVDELKDYDWVTFSKTYAKNHGESRFGEDEYKIIEQEVSIDDLWWDGNDINEFGYDTGNTKKYNRRELQEIYNNFKQETPKKITVEDVLSYANSSERELTTKEKIDLQDVIMSLGLDNSYQALNRLEEALENKGVISFNKQRMLSSGVFNVLEVDKILNSEELQNNIKEAYKALKNTPLMEVSYPKESVYTESTELNSFGKQKVKNPYLYEQEVLVNQEVPQGAKPLNIIEGTKVAKVKTINEQGELVNKTDGSDTKAILEAVVISEENQKLADNLVLITQGISANVWNSNKEAVAKVVREIKNDAKTNGIDLKNIQEKVFTKSREEIIDFFDSMEDFLETENSENFAPIYNEMFDLNKEQTQVIKTDSNLDVILEDNITEYEAFKNFNLVKKAPNVYRRVKDMSLEEVYNVSAINKGTTVEELEKRIQSNPLDVVEFEVDAETLEKLQLWKEHLGFSNNIPQQMKEVSETIKEDNKWLLKSESPYFKITPYGLQAVSNDPLTLERAEMVRPKKEKVEEETDVNLKQREEALNNPLSIEKLKADHLYAEDILAVRNETKSFVRTPKGVFEIVFQSGNVSFYSKVVSKEKNYVNTNFTKYSYLETKPELFSKAKNYYSKKELDDINNENFDCN